MSSDIIARAPGKLFVLGEYAVLDGAPAVVAAVDRFAEVRLTRGLPGDRFQIEAPQLGTYIEAPVHSCLDVDGPLRFALAVLHGLDTAERATLLNGVRITITSEMTAAPDAKPGLGSSAAVTAALTAAIFHLRSGAAPTPATRPAIFAAALRSHRLAQGGQGSGADVAASVFGGLIQFDPSDSRLPPVATLPLPTTEHFLAAWTGVPASSAELVARYLSLNNGHTRLRTRFVERSRALTESFVSSLGNADDNLECIDHAGALLEAFAYDTGLPIVTPPLQRLLETARRGGAVAKISGAGGGDCGIAFAQDAARAASICAEWRNAGLIPLSLKIAGQGVNSVDG